MSATQPVFDVDEVRGLLVIRPGGDAVGYRDIDVAREVDQIRRRIDALDSPRVLVDLAHARYVGSVMIGAISDFAERVRAHDGAFGVCHVSPEMAFVLKAMKLDERWPQFGSRHDGVQALRRP